MLIHKLTSGERPVYTVDGKEVQTNFTRYEHSEKRGCISLYNNDLYVGIVKTAHVKSFIKALAAAKTLKVA